jgi:hypothetical protein
MDRRRFLQLDFSRTALDRHNEQILERIRTAGAPANDSQRERLLERLAAASAAIAARGGRVLLVHFPHGGEVREIEERRYPPASYWDAVVSAAIAPTLDLRDDARIGALALPDGSHVDQRDAPAFTRLFVSRLRELLLSRSTAPGPVPERQAPQDGPERRAPAEQGVNGEHQGQPKIPSAGSWSDPTELFGHGPTGSWDAILWGGFAATAIARDGSILLYYQGSSSYDERLESVVSRAIGVATSTDGRHFVKHPLNPVLTWSPTRSPEEGAASAAVLAEPDGETTLYFGANTAISRRLVTADGRCATSRDGMTFSLCEGVVLDHADRGLWASGDELFPVIALDRGGRRIVYYLPNGRLHRRHLGVAWGTSRTRLDASAAVTSAGRPVSSWGPGGWAPLSAESYALFLSVEPDRHAAREHVDVYVASAASPAEVSGPVEAYAFDDLSRGTVLLDVERATWFLYYRNRDGSGYRVRTAPLELTASTRAPARPAPAPAPAP